LFPIHRSGSDFHYMAMKTSRGCREPFVRRIIGILFLDKLRGIKKRDMPSFYGHLTLS
jgi:hypothetical protein